MNKVSKLEEHTAGQTLVFLPLLQAPVLSKYQPVFKPAIVKGLSWTFVRQSKTTADTFPLSYLSTSPLDHPWTSGEAPFACWGTASLVAASPYTADFLSLICLAQKSHYKSWVILDPLIEIICMKQNYFSKRYSSCDYKQHDPDNQLTLQGKNNYIFFPGKREFL